MLLDAAFVDSVAMTENTPQETKPEAEEAPVLGDGAAGSVENPGVQPEETEYRDEPQPASPAPEPATPEQKAPAPRKDEK